VGSLGARTGDWIGPASARSCCWQRGTAMDKRSRRKEENLDLRFGGLDVLARPAGFEPTTPWFVARFCSKATQCSQQVMPATRCDVCWTMLNSAVQSHAERYAHRGITCVRRCGGQWPRLPHACKSATTRRLPSNRNRVSRIRYLGLTGMLMSSTLHSLRHRSAKMRLVRVHTTEGEALHRVHNGEAGTGKERLPRSRSGLAWQGRAAGQAWRARPNLHLGTPPCVDPHTGTNPSDLQRCRSDLRFQGHCHNLVTHGPIDCVARLRFYLAVRPWLR